MSEKPVVLSVIIPVYNAEETIGEALDSLLGQSLKEIEVICVDDGSKDASVRIIRDYMARDSRVSLIQQQNRYAGVARNAGMDAAKGEWLFFLDADDYVLNYALEAVCDKARKHRLDFLKFLSLTWDEKENRYISKARNSGTFLKPEDYNRLVALEEGSPMLAVSVTPWTGIYRRAFVEEKHCRFNELQCVNDRSFFTKCMTCAERMMISRDRVVVHRENRDGSLVGNKARHFDCVIDSVRITERQLKEDGIGRATAELIMTQEYLDLVFWYVRFSGDGERRAEMDRLLREYLESGESSYSVMLPQMLNRAAKPMVLEPERAVHGESQAPAVSVVVYAQNAEDGLNETLSSLTNQTAEDLEFLLVDDASADGSRTIMMEYAEIDRRFVILDGGGAGYGAAMNRGLAKARGEYIALEEAGDSVPADYYEKLYEDARKYGADLVRTDTERFRFRDGKRESRRTGLPAGGRYGRTVKPSKHPEILMYPVQACGGICSRALLEEQAIWFNGEPGRLFRDHGFWFEIFSRSNGVRFLKEPLYSRPDRGPESLAVPEGEERNLTQEYRRLEERLGPRQAAFAGVLADRKLRGMLQVWSRLAPERKRPYLGHMREELQEAYGRNLFARQYLTRREEDRLEQVMADPQSVMDRIEVSVVLPAGLSGAEECARALTACCGAVTEVLRPADRNEGLRQARGEWVFFPEPGWLYEADTLDRALNQAEGAQADVVLLSGDGGAGFRAEMLPEKRPFAGEDMGPDAFRAFSGRAGDKLFRRAYLHGKGLDFPEAGEEALTLAALAAAERIGTAAGTPLAHGSGAEPAEADDSVGMLSALRENLERLGVSGRFGRDFASYALSACLRSLENAGSGGAFEAEYARLKNGGLAALGLADKPGAYFYDREDYRRMARLAETGPAEWLLEEDRLRRDTLAGTRQALEEEKQKTDPRLLSASYRLGRAVTWLPRKACTARRLVKEYGLRATADYLRGKKTL